MGGALGLLPVPGPFDEAVLLLVAAVLWLFYRDQLREAWRQARTAAYCQAKRRAFLDRPLRLEPVRDELGELVGRQSFHDLPRRLLEWLVLDFDHDLRYAPAHRSVDVRVLVPTRYFVTQTTFNFHTCAWESQGAGGRALQHPTFPRPGTIIGAIEPFQCPKRALEKGRLAGRTSQRHHRAPVWAPRHQAVPHKPFFETQEGLVVREGRVAVKRAARHRTARQRTDSRGRTDLISGCAPPRVLVGAATADRLLQLRQFRAVRVRGPQGDLVVAVLSVHEELGAVG